MDSISYGDILGAEDSAFGHAEDMEAVWQYSGELPEREQRMLMMRFYGNMTQEQIARKMGMSQMHVSRLLAHALTQLRSRLEQAQAGEPAADQEPPRT